MFPTIPSPPPLDDASSACIDWWVLTRGDSGLLMMATEQPRLLSYYIPALGPAPRWSSFLDVLTEELEEEGEASVYEDYKFVTSAEVGLLRRML